MGTFRDREFMLVGAALTTVILIVGAGAASDYGQNQQQYGDQTSQQQGYSSGSRMGSRAGMQGNRNQQLEKQVASQLRDQGLGQQGQILVLAIGNRVILLGQVPDQNLRQQADQAAHQVSGVSQVDNRLVVLSETTRKSGTQLTRDIQNQLNRLPANAGQNIQVQSRNGRIILRGQVDNWSVMADAIQAAFTAGAPYVVSQITTAGQRPYATRSGYGQYGYQPPEEREYGQGYEQDRYQDQQYGGMGARDRWRQTGEDKRMEQRLTTQLRTNVQGIADITVLVAGNQAFLFGRTQSENAKNQAALWIQQASGIRRVQNNLIVAPQGWQRKDDTAIQDTIRDEFRASPHLTAENIGVSVRNGVATLTGRVDTFGELVAAIQNAYQAGARTVRNRLTVTGQATAGARGMQGGYYPSYGYGSGQGTGQGYGTQGGYYQPYGGTSDQSMGGGYGTQGGYAQPYGGTSDQSMGSGTNTWSGSSSSRSGTTTQSTGVLYQYGDNRSNQSMNRGFNNEEEQGDYYPSYGYTPSESDEESEDMDEDEVAQVGQQRTSEDEFTPSSQQQQTQPMGRQRMNTADMILAQRVGLELQRQLPGEQTIHVLDPHAIYVAVSQGAVTLHGFVQNSNERQQAEQIVRSIRGVQTVQNQLLLASEATAFPPLGYVPDQGTQTGRTYQGGYTTGTQQPTTGQQMTTSDRTLTQQIDQQIRQQLPNASIIVTVNQGMAMLTGTALDNSQKQQAEQIARSISGVRTVQNNITISGQPSTMGQTSATGQPSSTTRLPSTTGQTTTGFQQAGASDKILARQVALELQQQLPSSEVVYVLDQQAINVMVTQGTVMLHGSVPDQNLKQQAEQIARSVSGARNVRNELTIMGQAQRTAMGTMGQPQQMTASDSRLADQIKQQISQQLPSANINVMVSQGTVMLHGSVQDQSQKQQAEQIAKSVSGLQTVQNDLTVGAAGTAFPPLGYIPGQEGAAGQQDTGSADDIRCTQMLKQSLTNQNLKDAANNIFVTCHNGQMALYGNVKTDDEKDQIGRTAKQVQGIKNVDNNLTVRKETAEQKSDAQLKEDVESQLWWSPFVDSTKIDVTAQNGVVTLSGTVKDWDAQKAAVKNAFDAGAKRVRSKLQMESQPSTAMSQTGTSQNYGATQQ